MTQALLVEEYEAIKALTARVLAHLPGAVVTAAEQITREAAGR